MIYNNVMLTVKETADIPRVQDALKELARASLDEAGCKRFDVFQSQGKPALFMLIEEWVSQSALDEHRGTPAFAEVYMPLVVPLVERSPHACDRLWPDGEAHSNEGRAK